MFIILFKNLRNQTFERVNFSEFLVRLRVTIRTSRTLQM